MSSGIKNLNFNNNDKEFDAVAEWTRFRSLSLLEQFPPCTVLIVVGWLNLNLNSVVGEQNVRVYNKALQNWQRKKKRRFLNATLFVPHCAFCLR